MHAGHEAQVLVEREHLDVLRAGVVQRAHRDGRAVGERELGVGGEAPGLAQVGEHRPLVLAVLELAVQLRQAHHRRVELAGEDLQPARQLRHLDLAALDALGSTT